MSDRYSDLMDVINAQSKLMERYEEALEEIHKDQSKAKRWAFYGLTGGARPFPSKPSTTGSSQ